MEGAQGSDRVRCRRRDGHAGACESGGSQTCTHNLSVRGKGKTLDHRRAGREKLIPEIHVPVKGASNESQRKGSTLLHVKLAWRDKIWCYEATRNQLCRTCWRKLVAVRNPAKTFYDFSPVGSSASNGVAERGVQTVEGQIRVLKDAFETRVSPNPEQPQHACVVS